MNTLPLRSYTSKIVATWLPTSFPGSSVGEIVAMRLCGYRQNVIGSVKSVLHMNILRSLIHEPKKACYTFMNIPRSLFHEPKKNSQVAA